MNNELGTYLYKDNIQAAFLSASQTLYNAVAHTIGPNGTNTAIPTSNDFLSIINDGKTIIETISSNNAADRLTLNTLKESAFATNKEAGDGTTSTVVLQHKLLDNILMGEDKIDSSYVESIRDRLLVSLPNYKKEIKTEKDLRDIITVALGSGKFTDIVYDAFNGLDKTQKPAIIKANSQKDTDCINIDGINLAPVEVNPVVLKSMSASNDEPLDIIILNQEVSRIDNQFALLLKNISTSNKKTILLYTDIKPSVMDQLLYNIQEGALNLILVRLAMNVQHLDEIISDLEEYFGCTAYSDLNPYQTNITPAFVGKGIGYILNKDSIIIKNENDSYGKKEHLVPSSSSVIQVGFITYSQQAEDFRRIEDAVQSAYNAINYGYVLGAGYTYFCLAQELNTLGDKAIPIKNALEFIFLTLVPKYITQTEFITNIENGIYDSYKVAEQVILNAFTVVSQILSTNCLLVPYQRNRTTGYIEE